MNWHKLSLRTWVAQIIWLAIIGAMFYFGSTHIIAFFNTTDIDPNSVLGVLLSFLPIWFVVLLFAIHAIYRAIVNAIFQWQDNRTTDS